MSKYKKPKCDCGTFLQVMRSEYWSVTRTITKDGQISDKIGKYIAGKRKFLGMTQKQLAEKLGMSDKSVSK